MGLLFVPLYIKFIGIEAYGLIGLFGILQTWLSLLDMGLMPMLTREMAQFSGGARKPQAIRNLLRSVELVAASVAVLFAIILWAASGWFASHWFKVDRLSPDVVIHAFSIMGFVTALRFVEGIYRSSLVGLQHQVLFNLINSGMATLRGLGAIAVLAWISPSIQAFFLWQGVISMVTLASLAAATYTNLPRTEHRGHFSIHELRGVWRFAGGLAGITFLNLLAGQTDKVLLSKIMSLSAFGYYALAAAVAGALFVLTSPITQAWYPRFCELHARDDEAGLADAYHKAAQLLSLVAGSVSIVLIMFSGTFLLLWSRDAVLVQRVGPLLSLLALGNLLSGIRLLPEHAQLAHGWTSLTIRFNIVATLISIPAILWAVPRYGPQGAAWIWICVNASYLLIGVPLMHRRILRHEKWTWYVRDVGTPLATAFLAALIIKLSWGHPIGIVAQFIELAMASILTPAGALLGATEYRKRAFHMLDHAVRYVRKFYHISTGAKVYDK